MLVYKLLKDSYRFPQDKKNVYRRGICNRSLCKFCTCRIRSLSSLDNTPTLATAGTNVTFKRSKIIEYVYVYLSIRNRKTCGKICAS
jgi:hypothetical protein